jgi:hypothetical protein
VLALSAAAIGLCACGDEPEEADDDRVPVRISFDQEAYVDAATTNAKVIERVRRQNESVLYGLHTADVIITKRKLVEVDLGHLKREPVTVVDESGITRAALRLRYHFVALADAPKEVAEKGMLRLGALHTVDPAQAEIVRAACTSNRADDRKADLWKVFDAGLPRCNAAIAREYDAIVEARKALAHPEAEIATREFERLYVPVAVWIVPRQRPDGGGGPDPPVGAVRRGGGNDAWLPSIPGLDIGIGEDDEQAARDLSKEDRPVYFGPTPRGDNVNTALPSGAGRYIAPNFAVVYFAIASIILLLLGGRKRGWGRRK